MNQDQAGVVNFLELYHRFKEYKMKIDMEKLFVGIVILILLYYTFKHISVSSRVVYNVRPSVPWNNVLYGKANSRRNKRVPLQYPQLAGKGPSVPRGAPPENLIFSKRCPARP